MEVEIWKDIAGYEGLYQISSLGRVKRLSRMIWGGKFAKFYRCKEIMLKQTLSTWKYYCVDLRKNNAYERCLVHRLVGVTFIPNPENKPEINHKNGDKLSNFVDNFEWVTHKENIRHAFRTGLVGSNGMTGRFGKLHPNSMVVYQYALSGDFIAEFDSLHDINRDLGLNISHLSACANKKRKTVGGFIWSYYKLNKTEIDEKLNSMVTVSDILLEYLKFINKPMSAVQIGMAFGKSKEKSLGHVSYSIRKLLKENKICNLGNKKSSKYAIICKS